MTLIIDIINTIRGILEGVLQGSPLSPVYLENSEKVFMSSTIDSLSPLTNTNKSLAKLRVMMFKFSHFEWKLKSKMFLEFYKGYMQIFHYENKQEGVMGPLPETSLCLHNSCIFSIYSKHV